MLIFFSLAAFVTIICLWSAWRAIFISICNFLSRILEFWFYRKYLKTTHAKAHEAMWLAYLKTRQDTIYGKRYKFAKFKSVDDFRRACPVVEYDDIKNYCEEVWQVREVFSLTESLGYCQT